MASPSFSWLDDFFGPAVVKLLTTYFPKRPVLEFRASGGTSVDVEDDPLNDAIVVTLTGDAPGGAVGSLQYHALDGSDDVFRGTTVLVNADGGLDFTTVSATPEPKSGWNTITTTDASSHKIGTITLPSSGDGIVNVHAELSYAYASSGQKGGTYAFKAEFKRDSGTLSLVTSVDLSPAGFAIGTAPATAPAAAANGNTEIDINVTGIAATSIKWVLSFHAQVVI